MKIKKLHIQNYKSLVNLEIIEPNPFTVFAGSNGAGKSNIFEALEFISSGSKRNLYENVSLFGGIDSFYSINNFSNESIIKILLELDGGQSSYSITLNHAREIVSFNTIGLNIFDQKHPYFQSDIYAQFISRFGRIFVNNTKLQKENYSDGNKLRLDSLNLEKVLARLLRDTSIREEFMGWLDLLIPGFSNIEIVSEQPRVNDTLIIYEKGTNKPFTKNLLSDGTWNILALLTAVYQSDEPQFLCIEEPENGLNPKVQKELVNLFRQKCEDEGHYIWLNTHSQTIVNQLTPKELILVDKVDGETKIKQLTDSDTSGLSMDEAWLTNTLGGGIPW